MKLCAVAVLLTLCAVSSCEGVCKFKNPKTEEFEVYKSNVDSKCKASCLKHYSSDSTTVDGVCWDPLSGTNGDDDEYFKCGNDNKDCKKCVCHDTDTYKVLNM